MSLLKKFKQQREEAIQEAVQQIQENRAKLNYEGMTISDNPAYANLGINKNDVIGFVQSEIVKISPIFSPIIMKNLKVSNRNFIVSTNGKYITVGQKFFTENIEIVIAETLKVAIGLSLGHYVSPKYKSETTEHLV